MYEQVDTKPRDKKGLLLRVLLPVAIAVMLIGSVVLTWAVRYHVQYRILCHGCQTASPMPILIIPFTAMREKHSLFG